MDPLDIVELAIALAMVVLGALFVWTQALERLRARRRRPVEARVVSVERVESRGRAHRWYVRTLYDVPGRGVLPHTRFFSDEGPALLWSRLHREGSVHRVIPGSANAGAVFLPEEMKWDGLVTALVLAVMTGFTAWAAYVLFMEYWAE